MPHVVYPGGIALGDCVGTYQGTDAYLPHDEAAALGWLLTSCPARTVVAEGSLRCADAAWLRALRRGGWQVAVAVIEAPARLARARRAGRARFDAAADETAACRRLARVCDVFAPSLWRIDGTALLLARAGRLRTHPVIEALCSLP